MLPLPRFTAAPLNRPVSLVVMMVVITILSAPGAVRAQSAAGVPQAAVLSGTAEENLLVNHDFADVSRAGKPLEWEAVGAVGTVDREDDEASPRGTSGRLWRADRGEGFWRQAVLGELEPGARYVLSAWVRGEPGAVAFLGVEGVRGDRGAVQRIYRGLAHTGWQPVSMEFTAPSTGKVRVWLGAEFSGSLWWTNAFLGRAEELPDRLARIWEERLRTHDRVYTGLVVDARGLGVERGMSPRIEDTDGNLLYTGAGADFEWVIRRGIVSYMKDLRQAMEHPRLAAHELYPYRLPMVVRAVGKVDDGFDASVIVRAHDADVIRRQLMRYDFLARFAVVFLVD